MPQNQSAKSPQMFETFGSKHQGLIDKLKPKRELNCSQNYKKIRCMNFLHI